ncbi:LRR repeats and ubiquitin-like domain-containing protein [Vitis vinifera]|uniref:LRR repeats and ubiquitin-like domain-containing protein n=1 Tax=Vitis vinifera TaxID=29760 RepID=A0A438KNQ4_VITVI|nr:LRR repeats and ubiquitin-like domain-containing protein [Vitis vinifera]
MSRRAVWTHFQKPKSDPEAARQDTTCHHFNPVEGIWGRQENVSRSVAPNGPDRMLLGASKVVRSVMEGLTRGPTRVLPRGQSCGGIRGQTRGRRVLDLNNNFIQDVPVKIGCLSSMQKLLLSANDILDESISWEGVVSLKSLTVLSLSQNYLTMLPSALGALTSLRQLHIASNKLTKSPIQIGLMTQLEVLKANNNRISTISTQIGDCNSLIEVEVSSNLLSELPETFSNLQNLKVPFYPLMK